MDKHDINLDCVAIVFGRKGSKGVPGKNTMEICGRPISHYPMLAASDSKYVSNIFLSTDDENIKMEAKNFNVDVIDRPKDLCTDSALLEDALIHGYREIIKRLERTPDILVILMCNAPTVNSELIDKGIEALINDPEADSAVTVSKLNMYSPLRARKLDSNGYLEPFIAFENFGNPSTLSCDRDSQGDVFFADMSHSISRSRAIDDLENGLLPQKWMGKKIIPVYQTYGCDIDDEWQIEASKWWIAKNGLSKTFTE
jgi:CMP-N-acetylneuraminic acid synthetase